VAFCFLFSGGVLFSVFWWRSAFCFLVAFCFMFSGGVLFSVFWWRSVFAALVDL